MDGRSSEPRNVVVKCSFDERTHEATVRATWEAPDHPHGTIVEYAVVLFGNATYHDEQGRLKEDQVGPITKAVLVGQQPKMEFIKQPPNTKFFVR